MDLVWWIFKVFWIILRCMNSHINLSTVQGCHSLTQGKYKKKRKKILAMPEGKENEKDQRSQTTEQYVDKGFAWIVLLGSFIANMLSLGTMKSFGVLYIEMVEYFSSGSGNTAFIGSIAWFLIDALAPVANLLSRKFSFRRVSVASGILLGLGYFLSGFVTRMEILYLTFTLSGIGYGLSFATSATIVSYYFKKRRALANGIMMSASGVGAFSFPFLYRFLIEKYGLLHAMWIIGAVISNICVAGCVFRQPTRLMKSLEQNPANKDIKRETYQDRSECITPPEQRNKNKHPKTKRICCENLDLRFSLFKNRVFSMYVIAFVFSTFGHVNNLILIPSHVKALGYDKSYVALSVTITGGAEIIARIFIGWIADLQLVRTKYIFAGCMFIGAIFSLITPLFDSFTYMAVYAAVQIFFPGSFFSLTSVLAIEAVGMDYFSQAFGLILLSTSFASAIPQPISGWMYDYFGSWHLSFVLTGTAFICAGVTVLLEPLITRCFRKQKYIDSDTDFEMTAEEEGKSFKGLQTQSQDSSVQAVDNEALGLLKSFGNDGK